MSLRQLQSLGGGGILAEFPFGLSFKVNIVTSNTRAVTQARRISSDVVRISIERTTLPPSRLTCSKSPSLPSQPLLRTCGHSLAGGQIPSAFQRVGSINCPERRSHAAKEPSWVLISVSTNHFDCVYWPGVPVRTLCGLFDSLPWSRDESWIRGRGTFSDISLIVELSTMAEWALYWFDLKWNICMRSWNAICIFTPRQ